MDGTYPQGKNTPLVWEVEDNEGPSLQGEWSAIHFTTVILLWCVHLLMRMSSCSKTLCVPRVDLGVSLWQHSGCDCTNNQKLITANAHQHKDEQEKGRGIFPLFGSLPSSLSLSLFPFLPLPFPLYVSL